MQEPYVPNDLSEVVNPNAPGDKPKMRGLFRDNPETPEGKYLVCRRDGSVVEWPSFVLGARDPMAAAALRAYAAHGMRILYDDPAQAERLGLTREFLIRIFALADEFDAYRAQHGEGDPGRGRHRKDDPATIAKMRLGRSA